MQSPSAPIAHTISSGWISTGGTGAQNYDEFASDAEITEILRANPSSMLGVEMPHRTPEAVAAGWSFADALPHAVERLGRLHSTERLHPFTNAVVPYRITADDGVAYGVFCLVDTDQISASASHPGLVIRNEDVFPEKVGERTALTRVLGVLASPVLLLQTGADAELHAYLAELIGKLGQPAVTDIDQHGREHAVWLLNSGPECERLLALASSGELVVADGNHRSLAAQEAGLTRFLAVITTPESVQIQPYQRLLRALGRPADEVLNALRAAGVEVRELPGVPAVPAASGTVVLYLPGQAYELHLSTVREGSVVDRLDHAIVEQLVFHDVLGLDAGDKTITYVGGDYPVSWLTGEVNAGRAAAALLIAPVTVEDFIAVNLTRLKMPRKSTWFTPKVRTGLVLAEVEPGTR